MVVPAGTMAGGGGARTTRPAWKMGGRTGARAAAFRVIPWGNP